MANLDGEGVVCAPAIDGQNRAAAVFDAVRQRFAAGEFQTDEFVAGEPSRGKVYHQLTSAPRAVGGALKTPLEPYDSAHLS